jgi:hypothetical protein
MAAARRSTSRATASRGEFGVALGPFATQPVIALSRSGGPVPGTRVQRHETRGAVPASDPPVWKTSQSLSLSQPVFVHCPLMHDIKR